MNRYYICFICRTHHTVDRHISRVALSPLRLPLLSIPAGSGRVGVTLRNAGRYTAWRIRISGVLSVNGRKPVLVLYLKLFSKSSLHVYTQTQCYSVLFDSFFDFFHNTDIEMRIWFGMSVFISYFP